MDFLSLISKSNFHLTNRITKFICYLEVLLSSTKLISLLNKSNCPRSLPRQVKQGFQTCRPSNYINCRLLNPKWQIDRNLRSLKIPTQCLDSRDLRTCNSLSIRVFLLQLVHQGP